MRGAYFSRLSPMLPQIPDHSLIRRIGNGAYGEVWLAKNVMGALRAVKIVRRECFTSDRPYEREFDGIRKFEPLSRAHESQLDILHVGRDDAAGLFFYVMELGDDIRHGQEIDPETYAPYTLHSGLQERQRFPARDCVEVGIALCTALAQIHKHGLIHRDIKPSNVIFVHGRAKLADIGLVTEADEDASFVGTEGYVPQEGPGSARADLFSLGRVLYEISTGFNQRQFPEVPTSFGADDDELARDLNLVIHKACARDARERHSSATLLREELLLLKSGRSIRRLRDAERRVAILKWCGLAALVVALFATTGYISASRANHLANLAVVQARLAQAHALRTAGQMGRRVEALSGLAEAARIRPSLELRNEAIASLALTDLGPAARLFPAPAGAVVRDNPFCVALNPSGSQIAWARDDGSVSVQDALTGKEIADIPALSRTIYGLAWSPNGEILVITSKSKTLLFYCKQKRTLLIASTETPPSGVGSMASFSADSTRVGLPVKGEAVIYALPSATVIQRLRPIPSVGLFSLHPTTQVAVFADKRDAVLWDLAAGKELERRPVGSNSLAFSWSPDGLSLAVAAREGAILVFNGRSDRVFARYGHPAAPVNVQWHPDGQRLVACTVDGHSQIWRVDTGALPLVELSGNAGLGFTGDGRNLVAVANGNLAVLPLIEPAPVYSILSGPVGVSAFEQITFSPDGSNLVSLSNHDGAWFWDCTLARGIEVREVRGHSRSWIGFAPDGQALFTLGSDGVERWPIKQNGSEPRLGAPVLLPDSVPYKSGGTAALSADGNQLLFNSHSDRVMLVDLTEHVPPMRIDPHFDVGALAWRPDGRQFALTGLGERSVTLLYDSATRQPLKRFEGGQAGMAWSRDGRFLAQLNATGCELFDAVNLKSVALFPREFVGPIIQSNARCSPCGVAFSDNGSLMAFLTTPERIALVDTATRSIVATVTLPDRAVAQGVLLSPDGGTLLVHDIVHAHLYNIREMRGAIAKLGLDW
ncbi:MAG: putative Serine/threonine protein kinase with repeat [Chthoniobacteraceae bacterium]|nr:putative Serine/threonine protein kinase with repeat [Chthoniobacteraceae bacterium]